MEKEEKPIRAVSIIQIGVLLEQLIETSETEAEQATWAEHLETWNNCYQAAGIACELGDNPYVWVGEHHSLVDEEDL